MKTNKQKRKEKIKRIEEKLKFLHTDKIFIEKQNKKYQFVILNRLNRLEVRLLRDLEKLKPKIDRSDNKQVPVENNIKPES